MSKLVVFEIGEGDFNERGFPITLQIGEEGKHFSVSTPGKLPPNPDILENFNSWRSAYLKLENLYRLSKKQEQPSGGSFINDCNEAANLLINSFNDWLNTDALRSIREKFIQNVKASDEMRLLVKTDDLQIQRLPWRSWNLFESYTNDEVTIIPCAYEAIGKTPVKPKVRILAILGDSTGIDTQADARSLKEQLPDTEAEIEFLPEPSRQKLTEHLWSEEGWDILYFAGHSSSEMNGQNGWIKINQNDDLSIKDLKQSLKKAVENGLKLAIFNSCDGLGLASSLTELCIPNIIVMREPVPDKVSQAFLKYFLEAFYRGEILDSAVKEARGKLEGLENEFPCASWLPVPYKTSQEAPPSWKDWIEDKTQNPRFSLKLRDVFAISLAVASMVVGARWLGKLQPMELSAYDQLMRLRAMVEEPKPDNKLLIVAVNKEDVDLLNQSPDEVGRGGRTLSDLNLQRLLQKIDSHNPSTIGLDIFVEGKISSKYPKLKAIFQDGKVVATCFTRSKINEKDIEAPGDVPSQRKGHAGLTKDDDNIIRRYTLFHGGLQSQVGCKETGIESFSFQVAQHYLSQKGINRHRDLEDYKSIVIGKTRFTILKKNRGGYHHKKSEVSNGIQFIINYHPYQNYKTDIAKTVSLTDILNDKINPKYINGKIVLIGSDILGEDYHNTPFTTSNNPSEQLPGVFVHAQALSNILDIVESQFNGEKSKFPLIWTWDWWIDVIWIYLWSLVGGMIVWLIGLQENHKIKSLLTIVLLNAIVSSFLYSICFVFIQLLGGWIPLLPSAIALFVTSSSITIYMLLQPKVLK